MRVRMGYPDAQPSARFCARKRARRICRDLRPVLTGAEVLEMQEAVKLIRVDESLVTYALEIVRRTRESEFLSLGVSPRGAQALYRAAQAMAFSRAAASALPKISSRWRCRCSPTA